MTLDHRASSLKATLEADVFDIIVKNYIIMRLKLNNIIVKVNVYTLNLGIKLGTSMNLLIKLLL